MRRGLYLAALAIATGPAGAQATYPSAPHAPIPNLSPVGVRDSVLVDALIDVWDVDATLTLSHTWTGDLVITLTDPLDSAVTDDNRVFHGVTPVTPLDPTSPGHRDVLVVTFRRE